MRDVPEWAGVPHMFDLPFVWGLPHSSNTPIQWNAADKKMSDVMMSVFSTFAKTGNPSFSAVKWEPYTVKNPGVLVIKERSFEMSAPGVIDHKALAFWSEYYPVVLDAATNNCCNTTGAAMSIYNLDHVRPTLTTIGLLTIYWQFSFYCP